MPKITESHASPHFEKQFDKLPANLQKIAARKLIMFENNPFYPGLETHKLKGQTQINSTAAGKLKIKNLNALSMKINGYKFGTPTFKLEVSGKAEVESEVDVEAVKNSIIEKGLYDPAAVLTDIPALSRAEVRFKPFWIKLFKRYFITTPTRIDIVLE